jgi:hypothetical protein
MVEHTIHRRVQFRPGAVTSMLSLMALMALLALLLGNSGVAYAAPNIAAIAPDIDVGPVTPTAAAGGTIMYKIQVQNANTASEDLARVHVTLRYDPNTLTLIDSKLRDKNDWISRVDGGKATVQFGTIDRQDERSATLIFHVNAAVAVGAPILTDAAFDWRTADADGTGGLAIDNVIAIGPNAVLPATIAPNAGPAGMSFAVVATGFQANEQVVTWLNTPTIVQGLPLSGATDDGGNIQLQFDSAGLAPGYYGLVLHGLDSGREYLLPFNVIG